MDETYDLYADADWRFYQKMTSLNRQREIEAALVPKDLAASEKTKEAYRSLTVR